MASMIITVHQHGVRSLKIGIQRWRGARRVWRVGRMPLDLGQPGLLQGARQGLTRPVPGGDIDMPIANRQVQVNFAAFLMRRRGGQPEAIGRIVVGLRRVGRVQRQREQAAPPGAARRPCCEPWRSAARALPHRARHRRRAPDQTATRTRGDRWRIRCLAAPALHARERNAACRRRRHNRPPVQRLSPSAIASNGRNRSRNPKCAIRKGHPAALIPQVFLFPCEMASWPCPHTGAPMNQIAVHDYFHS